MSTFDSVRPVVIASDQDEASDSTTIHAVNTKTLKQLRSLSPTPSVSTLDTFVSSSTFEGGTGGTEPLVVDEPVSSTCHEEPIKVVLNAAEASVELPSCIKSSRDNDSLFHGGYERHPYVPIICMNRNNCDEQCSQLLEAVVNHGGDSTIYLLENDAFLTKEVFRKGDACFVIMVQDHTEKMTSAQIKHVDVIVQGLLEAGVGVVSSQEFKCYLADTSETQKDLLLPILKRTIGDLQARGVADRNKPTIQTGRPLSHRLSLLLLAFLQVVLVNSIWFGWSCVAEEEGSLMMSPKDQGGGGLTVQETTGLFGVAASVSLLAGLPIGFILDRFGPRACSVVTHLCVWVGCFIFSLEQNKSYTLLSVGMAGMAAGSGITTSVVHVGNLFEQVNLVVAGLAGSSSFSFAILPLFAWIWERSDGMVSVQDLFGYYQYLVLVSMLASLILWPDEPYQEEKQAPSTGTVEKEEEVSRDMPPSWLHEDESLLQQASSGTYIRILLYRVVTFCLANFALAAFPVELEGRFADSSSPEAREWEDDLSHIFTLIFSCGIVAAFAVGYTMDSIGLELCTILSLVFGQAHQVLTMLLMKLCGNDEQGWILIQAVGGLSFLVYTFFRQFLFPVYVSSVSTWLGFRHFGTLVGIANILSGVTQMAVAAPLIGWIDKHSMWTETHWAQVFLFGWLITLNLPDGSKNLATNNGACCSEEALGDKQELLEQQRGIGRRNTASTGTTSSYGSMDCV